jgi:hypothetical protein
MRASAVVVTNVDGGPAGEGAVEIGLRSETPEQAAVRTTVRRRRRIP